MGDEGREQSRQTREIVGFSTEAAQNPAHDKRESRQAVAFSKRAMQAAGGGNHHHVDDVLDPELRQIVAAWPALPEGMKRAMLAIVEAAK